MGGKIFNWTLKQELHQSMFRLNTLPELREVDSSTRRLFESLTEEYNHMFSLIIEYLSQDND